MANLRVQRRRGKRSDDGASLVEFALIMPLLFLLLIGTLTGGLTLSRQNAVKNAIREASRHGAVLPTFTNYSANLSALYEQTWRAASGDLNPGVPDRVVCVALIDEAEKWYYAIYRDSHTATPSITGTVASSLPAQVKEDCNTAAIGTVGIGTQRVWIRASRTSEIEALFYSFEADLQATSLSRYER